MGVTVAPTGVRRLVPEVPAAVGPPAVSRSDVWRDPTARPCPPPTLSAMPPAPDSPATTLAKLVTWASVALVLAVVAVAMVSAVVALFT